MINDFLDRQKVDVSRSLAVLLFASGLQEIATNLGGIVARSPMDVHFGFLFSIPLAIGLWRYRPLARNLCIAAGWLMAFVLLLLILGIPYLGETPAAHFSTFNLRLGDVEIENPTPSQALVASALGAGWLFLILKVLHSQKFYREVEENRPEVAEPGRTGGPDLQPET